jgi:hypothetical protein
MIPELHIEARATARFVILHIPLKQPLWHLGLYPTTFFIRLASVATGVL